MIITKDHPEFNKFEWVIRACGKSKDSKRYKLYDIFFDGKTCYATDGKRIHKTDIRESVEDHKSSINTIFSVIRKTKKRNNTLAI